MILKKKIIINWTLLLIWMLIIFLMSHQPGDISSEQSKFVVYIFNIIGLDLNTHFGEVATLIVRKGAHFLEYMVLYFLAINVLKYYIKSKLVYPLTLLFVFAYACSDEFHQLFIQGRSGQVRDVLIDTLGGTIGMIIVYLKNILLYKYK